MLVWQAGAGLGIGPDAAAPAAAADLIDFGAQVRFGHPLVRSAVYGAATPEERQRVHRALAEATDADADPDRRAWHRAQAAAGLDEDVAAERSSSAGRARARGGLAAGAAFHERAAVLTPDPRRRAQRALLAAQGKQQAGAPDAAAPMTDLTARPRGGLAGVRAALTPAEWARAGAMAAAIIGLHVAGWGMLAAAAGGHYRIAGTQLFGVGTGVLAYTLGVRHAFDADHIAAIDNTTRKLAGDGQRPLSAGFFFSLGHCTVVFALAVLANLGIRAVNGAVTDGRSGLHAWTAIIGTAVSGTFLYLIAALNAVILASIITVVRQLRAGTCTDIELDARLDARGLMNRIFGGYARRIDAPGKMYPVGVLFGLGFDTATEVALLVLAGTAAAGGLPFYAALSLPVLFAAGMCLFDTADGCFMNFAYDWAFARPARKVFYNLTITALSVLAALFIATIEILGLLSQQLGLAGGFWTFLGTVTINQAGLVIAGIFILTWAVALSAWHFGKIEHKWDTAQPAPPD